jgi:hypothetical protein
LRQLGLEYTRLVAENSVQDVSHVPAAEKQGISNVFLWGLVGQQGDGRGIADGIKGPGRKSMDGMQHRWTRVETEDALANRWKNTKKGEMM